MKQYQNLSDLFESKSTVICGRNSVKESMVQFLRKSFRIERSKFFSGTGVDSYTYKLYYYKVSTDSVNQQKSIYYLLYFKLKDNVGIL